MGIGVRGQILIKNNLKSVFLDFALYGRWEPLDSLKMMSWDVGTFSNIENLILRTFIFRVV